MTPAPIAADVLATPVEGPNVEPGPLADVLGAGPTVLVFLRHYGCLFYRQLVDDFAAAVAADPAYPDVVFVYQGTVEQGPMFFGSLFPGARALADPEGRLYAAFGVERGGFREMFGLRSWRCGLQAARQGHFINRKVGDPWTLPTVLVVRDGAVVWTHRGEHAGDHPDVAAIPRALEGST